MPGHSSAPRSDTEGPMPETIVFLDPLSPHMMERLAAHVPPRFTLTTTASRDAADQLAAVEAADFAITGDVPCTAEMMRRGAAARLKAVHKWGVGYDNIDVAAAREAGIRVLRTTGSNAVPVAETALGLMLALNRRIVEGHQGVSAGEWPKNVVGPRTFMLSGKTVGLVGLGYIGKALARLLTGFGCTVVYAKPTPLTGEEEAALNVRHVPLAELLARSDVVSLHCALTPETRGLLGPEELAAMKRGAILINTARGGIVDEAGLADAIESGHIAGAGLDVFDVEPAEPGNRLVGMRGVVATPHIAAQAADNFARTVTRMFANLAHVADGTSVPELDVVV